MDRRGILAFAVILGALIFWLVASSARAEPTPVIRSGAWQPGASGWRSVSA